jgi:phage replication O-like protein O
MTIRSPQTEDGYTRIANELLDAMIQTGLSKREWPIVMAVIRMTYGYNRKEDALSGWQIAEMTGIARPHVSTSLSDLIERRVLIRSEKHRSSHGRDVHYISINKHYNEWQTVTKTVTVTDSVTVTKTVTPSYQNGNLTVTKTVTPSYQNGTHSKDSIKDNLKERRDKSLTFAQWIETIKAKNEKAISDYKPVWSLADKVGLPEDWIVIAWTKFRERYSSDPTYMKKKYTDWRRHFLNCIDGNWLNLWYAAKDGSGFSLTTAGVQADLSTREAA